MQSFTLIPQLGAGRGRLMRVGNTVIYSAGDAAEASALIGWCRLVGGRPPDDVMAELSRLTSGHVALGAFCAIVVGEHGFDVVMHGGVPLQAKGGSAPDPIGEGHTHLHDAASLDLIVGEAPIDALLSLDEGVVAADGFSLRAKTSAALPWSTPRTASDADARTSASPAPVAARPATPAAAPEPQHEAASTPAPKPAAVVSLADVGGDDLPAATPLPIVTPAASAPPADHTPAPIATPMPAPVRAAEDAPTQAMPVAAAPGTNDPAPHSSDGPQPVRVKGLVCARGHFNDPRTRFCASCGIAMHQTSFILTEDVRPPLGVLVMSDGTYYTLVTSLVFGRDPDDDPEVRQGRATGVTLIDPGNTISRVHAEIRAVEWDVHIVDHGSTNGTFVWSAESQQWTRLTPDQPVPLAPGSHVAFGRLTATYESSNRQKS